MSLAWRTLSLAIGVNWRAAAARVPGAGWGRGVVLAAAVVALVAGVTWGYASLVQAGTSVRLSGLEPGVGLLLALLVGCGISLQTAFTVAVAGPGVRRVHADLTDLPIGRANAMSAAAALLLTPTGLVTGIGVVLLAGFFLGSGSFSLSVVTSLVTGLATIPICAAVVNVVVLALRRGVPPLRARAVLAMLLAVATMAAIVALWRVPGFREVLRGLPALWFWWRTRPAPGWLALAWLAFFLLVFAAWGWSEWRVIQHRWARGQIGARGRGPVTPSTQGPRVWRVHRDLVRLAGRSTGMVSESLPWLIPVAMVIAFAVLVDRHHPGSPMGALLVFAAGVLTTGPVHRIPLALAPYDEFRVVGVERTRWLRWVVTTQLVWSLPLLVGGLVAVAVIGLDGRALVAGHLSTLLVLGLAHPVVLRFAGVPVLAGLPALGVCALWIATVVGASRLVGVSMVFPALAAAVVIAGVAGLAVRRRDALPTKPR